MVPVHAQAARRKITSKYRSAIDGAACQKPSAAMLLPVQRVGGFELGDVLEIVDDPTGDETASSA
jgi:hypothetical protein